VPKQLRDIAIRNGSLNDLNNLNLGDALSYELKANLLEMKRIKIPRIYISIDRADEYTFGEFLGLIQYVAVYSSVLRGVNPYDQPEVEHSKAVSFEMIRKH
jgi:glucose-6-phosphate isomerase